MVNASRQQLRITIEPPDGSSRPGGFLLCGSFKQLTVGCMEEENGSSKSEKLFI